MRAKTKLIMSMVIGVTFLLGYSCSKENSSGTSTTITSSSLAYQTAVAQDAESIDAISNKFEQNADNQANEVISSNFDFPQTKTSPPIVVTVSSNDTVTFPKTITLTYNKNDSVEDSKGIFEHISQTGTLIMVVDTYATGGKMSWKNHLIRTDTIGPAGFTIKTDSASITVSGKRTVKTLSWRGELSSNGLQKRILAKDTVNSTLTFTITNGNFTGQFTRNAARGKMFYTHFERATTDNTVWSFANTDTVYVDGILSGVNLMDSAYTRTISATLFFSSCSSGSMVCNSGQITDMEGSQKIILSYGSNGCETDVTATNSSDKSLTVYRKLDRSFKKWW